LAALGIGPRLIAQMVVFGLAVHEARAHSFIRRAE
jgi:hypothetical protein